MPPIGSLTADLKLESAAFIRDLKKAADATARNTSAMQRQMAGLQKGFASAATAFKGFVAGFATVAAVRQLANLGKQAIQTADDIATAATRIGISGEELQRFRFAAAQADVDIANLERTLTLFQKAVASGKIKSQSFDEFIQSIRDAPTHIEKVRIASEALGKSFQDAILLAAQSGDEFRKQYNSAFVISREALLIAGELDNQFRSLGNAVQVGFDEGFIRGFAGALDTTDQSLKDLNETARQFGELVGQSIANAIKAFRELDAWLEANLPEWLKNTLKGISGAGGPVGLPALEMPEFDTSGWDKIGVAAETSAAKVDKLTEGMKAAAAEAANMGAVHKMSADQLTQGWLSVADVIGGALGQLFEDNKAVAVAQALINVAQGVTAALAQYPPPLSFAMAAAQAAAGAVQIATIKSTKPGSSGSVKRPSAAGGSGKALSSSSSSPAPAQAQRAIFVNLQGSGRYTRDEVFSLIEQIVEAQKDGAQLVLSQP